MSAVIFLDSDLYFSDVKTEKNLIQKRKDHQRAKYITLKSKEIENTIPHQSRLLHAGGTPQF